MPAPTDQELVSRGNRGDEAALAELYRRHRDWVVALARRFTGSDADALDVLQETFAYLFRKFPGFVLTTNLRGFLFPVVRNNAYTVLRKRRKVVALDEAREQEAGQSPWQPTGSSDFERLVAALPEGHRDVVMLRFAVGCRLEEIAELLAIPVGTVKSRLHNALKSLRQLHEEPGEAGE